MMTLQSERRSPKQKEQPDTACTAWLRTAFLLLLAGTLLQTHNLPNTHYDANLRRVARCCDRSLLP